MSYIVVDEYDYSPPFRYRATAQRECNRWKLEGRNAEIVRKVPKHLEAKGAAIMPKFYPSTPDWWAETSEADAWDAPTVTPLELTPTEMWQEHRGWNE